ncbi:MAG: hypothetical protein J6K21_05740, partial [Bacilli bacterium]|nr:hypothetical protein [Bacilli bacterium]
YQTLQMLKNEDGLVKGKYNVVTETTVDDKKYKKINDLVTLKGTKPSGGTINILENKTVGSAMLCINGYVVEYLNKDVSIVGDDCSEMENIIEYIVDKEGYQVSRTLTINYPKGNYEYYYKVSGTAKIGEDIVEKDKEIKTTNNISILLEENQIVETWMLKNGKKISLRKYEEEQIDNVEIVSINIKDIMVSYPLLTSHGIDYNVQIELEYDSQEGTSPYYSIDNGVTWEKYTESVIKNISSNKIKAKMVRDKSKREGTVVEKEISLATDALGFNAYDNDTNTCVGNGTYYLNVDSSAIGKDITAIAHFTKSYDSLIVTAIGIDDTELITKTISNPNNPGERFDGNLMTIPTGTSRLKFVINRYVLCQFSIIDSPSIIQELEEEEPILTSIGIKIPNSYVMIDYSDSSIKKLYKIDDSDWLEYSNKIKAQIGQTVYAKGIRNDGTETLISSKKLTILSSTNTLSLNAYDNDTNTCVGDGTYYLNVDSSAIGKDITAIAHFTKSYDSLIVTAIGSDDTELITKTISNPNNPGERFDGNLMTIPTGTSRLKFVINRYVLCELE